MRLVPDAALRFEYRRQLWNSVKRRPHITCSAFFTRQMFIALQLSLAVDIVAHQVGIAVAQRAPADTSVAKLGG